jgi:hypothetical protein
MLYIFGDSHALFSFKGLAIPHQNRQQHSITMHRIGRDNHIINYTPDIDLSENNIVLCYGEVDCRCHIGKQILLGRKEDDVIEELVSLYFKTISQISKAQKIIIGVIPPVSQKEHEKIHGPITHEFPFVGSDEDRIRYTQKVNEKLKDYSLKNGYVYFNPYDYYTRNGILKRELSDNNCHLGDNTYFLNEFIYHIKQLTIYR